MPGLQGPENAGSGRSAPVSEQAALKALHEAGWSVEPPPLPASADKLATVSELQAGSDAKAAVVALMLSLRQAVYWATVAVQLAGGVSVQVTVWLPPLPGSERHWL